MNDLELQGVRDFILRSLARMPNGLHTDSLGMIVRAACFELPKEGADSLTAQLRYLQGSNLIAPKNKTHTPSSAIYQITPAGDDYLRTNGLL